MVVSEDILNVSAPAEFDDSITSLEYHTYLPYAASSFGVDDEIRIPLQNQDTYTLPSKSYLHIEGQLERPPNEPDAEGNVAALPDFPETTRISPNGFAHLFSDIRYELNGVVIDQTKNPGVSTALKGYVSYPESSDQLKMHTGWDNTRILNRQTGYFAVSIPLNHLLGFCEEFQRIVINMRQELVLIRSNVNTNVFETAAADANTTLKISRIYWRVPHVTVNDAERLTLLQTLQSDLELDMGFISWELHEYPLLNQTDRHSWTVKTAPKLQTPRYVILAFQTDRKNQLTKNASHFDHCNLTNARLFLNGVQYPYDNINVDFEKERIATLYQMYAHFQSSYYNTEDRPLKPMPAFKTDCPMVVFDCSHQNDMLKTGSVDVRLEWETKTPVPAKTAAYCLILHDKIVKYHPLSSAVRIV